MFSQCACGCATLAQAIQAITISPPELLRLYKIVGFAFKLNQWPSSPTNSLTAVIKKELSQFSYLLSRGTRHIMPPALNGNCYVMPELLLSAKHANASPCGLITKHIHNADQEKPGWLSKVVNSQENP